LGRHLYRRGRTDHDSWREIVHSCSWVRAPIRKLDRVRGPSHRRVPAYAHAPPALGNGR
jgi:hypothetical protein